MKLYPLTFRPVYKDYLWGGRGLAAVGKALPPTGVVAESWEISAHPNGPGVAADGALAGRTLAELTAAYGPRLLGTKYASETAFPLLVKFIDAQKPLSVQVHPGDDYARRRIGPDERGKNECWYVAAAREGAELIAGTKPGVDRAAFEKAVADGTVTDCLRRVPIRAGDFVFIPAGLVHAIGAGLLILEIQQSSDTTYRVYDYDRVGPDGRRRPLHLAQALDCIDFGLSAAAIPSEGRGVLTDNPFFRVENVVLDGERRFDTEGKHFDILTAFAGEGAALVWDGGRRMLAPGVSVLVPAEVGAYRLEGRIHLLRAY